MITFSKALSENELLSSHNNNIVEFSSDNVLTSVKCSISVDGYSFDITPINDVFRFNLKEIVSVLINENNFKDTLLPDLLTGYVYRDDSLWKDLAITYTIEFDGGSTEATTKNYHFIKSIRQIEKYASIDINTNKIAFLLPFYSQSNSVYYANYYEGFPFDIALYSDIDRTITIKNKTNGLTYDIDVEQGVNRIFLSDGGQTITFEDELPLVSGINELEFYYTLADFVTIILEKTESECAPLLKFFSNYGSYHYLRFAPVRKGGYKTKILDEVLSDYNDISESLESSFITGKTNLKTTKVMAQRLDANRLKYAIGVIDSPRVEMFMQDVFTKQEENSFNGVMVKDGSYNIIDTKKRLTNLQLDIVEGKLTMTL